MIVVLPQSRQRNRIRVLSSQDADRIFLTRVYTRSVTVLDRFSLRNSLVIDVIDIERGDVRERGHGSGRFGRSGNVNVAVCRV